MFAASTSTTSLLLLAAATAGALATATATPLSSSSPSSSQSAKSPPHVLAGRDVGVAATLAPLEQPSQVLFGSWVDMIGGTDTPAQTNDRFGFHKLGLFQTNMNIPDDLKNVPQLIAKIADTNTDAIVYLTVYPMNGFDAVTDAHIQELGGYLKTAADAGRRFMIRYAPEMNGNWFVYGQDPVAFIAGWRRFVTAMRAIVDNSKIAFLWSPNSSNGYPFLGGAHQPVNATAILTHLDTNKDGKFDMWDDPYSPYYPGDEFVSWTGLSMYHYGKAYPWVDNVLPPAGVFEAMLTGQVNYANGNYGVYNFYSMFAGDGRGQNVTTPVSAGGKPFMISETAAVFHQGYLKPGQSFDQATYLYPGPGILAIKQNWWRQIFNQTLFAQFPKLKGICFFEFRKQEEETLREFRVLGDHLTGNFSSADENTVASAFVADVKEYESKIRWAAPAGKAGVASVDGGSNGAMTMTSAPGVAVAAMVVALVTALLA
ncbi:hypothetical protein HDU88_004449 [Geranomyces variabilis]|nr:hypothetical protein HDU88_004449 [Geranomyces variabilis]